jgi:hypothetical protein
MALAGSRNTPRKGDVRQHPFKVEEDAVIYAGAMVAVNAAGYLVPAADTAGLAVVGVAHNDVDATGLDDGAVSCLVDIGVFGFANAGSNGAAQADIGRLVFVKDDQTVQNATGATNDVVAGILVEIDSAGVYWVDTSVAAAITAADGMGS